MEEQVKALTEQLQDLQSTVLAQQAVLLWLAQASAQKTWLPEVEIQGHAERCLEELAHSSYPDVVLFAARQKAEQLSRLVAAMQH